MPINDIQNSVHWVRSFVIQGVRARGESPDVRHAELHRLAHLVVQSIPLTFSNQAEFYQNKLKQIKDCYVEKLNLDMELENARKKQGQYKKSYFELEKIISLLKNAIKLAKKIERDKSSEDYECDQNEKNDLCKQLLELGCFSGENDEDEVLSEADNQFNEYTKELKTIKKNRKRIAEKIKCYTAKIEKNKKNIISLYNDIDQIQSNCFKGSIYEESPIIETWEVYRESNTYPEKKVTIDHSQKNVKAEFKGTTKNLVVANLTFVISKMVENTEELYEVSVPIKVPNESIVNLSIFKPAEYMSLSNESRDRGVCSNLFLETQIKHRYRKGATAKNIKIEDNFRPTSEHFSHSEQALFFALESPDVLKLVMKKLKLILNDSFKNSDLVLKNVFIDLYTTRYMCDDCAISAVGFAVSILKLGKIIPPVILTHLLKMIQDIENIRVAETCKIDIRASATAEFKSERKYTEDHKNSVNLSNNNDFVIFHKDLRIDNAVSDKNTFYIPPDKPSPFIKDRSLSRKLLDYTIFTSGSNEDINFKKAYAWAVRPALDKAAKIIQQAWRNYKCPRNIARASQATKTTVIMRGPGTLNWGE